MACLKYIKLCNRLKHPIFFLVKGHSSTYIFYISHTVFYFLHTYMGYIHISMYIYTFRHSSNIHSMYICLCCALVYTHNISFNIMWYVLCGNITYYYYYMVPYIYKWGGIKDKNAAYYNITFRYMFFGWRFLSPSNRLIVTP